MSDTLATSQAPELVLSYEGGSWPNTYRSYELSPESAKIYCPLENKMTKKLKTILDLLGIAYYSETTYSSYCKYGGRHTETRFITKKNDKKLKKILKNPKILKKKLLQDENYLSDLEFKKIKIKQNKEKNKLCAEVGLPADRYGKILVDYLDDVREASGEWLLSAYSALKYSMQNNGIMAQLFRSEEQNEFFYESMRKAMSAHYRHTQTEYDSVNKKGMSEESLNDLRAQFAR